VIATERVDNGTLLIYIAHFTPVQWGFSTIYFTDPMVSGGFFWAASVKANGSQAASINYNHEE
jgi:hypothetical protein